MKNLILFLLIFVQSLTIHAANIGDDTVNVGQKGSTGDKALIFRDANQTSLGVEHATSFLSWGGDQFKIGDGTNSDKKYVFDVGLGANNPFFLWNSVKNKLGFSNDGTSLKDIGSGSGGGGGENFNNAFTADQNANAEDGTTGWTASAGTFTATSTDPLEGDQSFEWTPAAQNDTLTSPVLDVDKDIFKGRSCEARITYIGGDENLSLKVLNGDNEELASQVLPAHGITGQESVFFICPTDAQIIADSDKGDLRLVIENTGASASALIKWDQSYLGTLRGLTEVTTPDVFSVRVDLNGNVISESADVIDGNCTKNGTGDYSCNFVAGIFTVTPAVVGTARATASGRFLSVRDSASTYVRILSYNHASSFTTPADNNFEMLIAKQGVDSKQSVQVYKPIPKVSENVNHFSAFVGSTGNIFGENVDWIDGTCSIVNSKFTCNFIPGLVDNPMNCAAQVLGGDDTNQSSTKLVSSDNLKLEFVTTTNQAKVNAGFNIICQKRESDFKTATVQPSIVGQLENTSSAAGGLVRVEACRIDNNGTASINSSFSNTCDWLSSASRTGSGDVVVGFDTGIFSVNPVCHATLRGAADSTLTINNVSATGITVNSRLSGTATGSDREFYLLCLGRK